MYSFLFYFYIFFLCVFIYFYFFQQQPRRRDVLPKNFLQTLRFVPRAVIGVFSLLLIPLLLLLLLCVCMYVFWGFVLPFALTVAIIIMGVSVLYS